MCYQNPARPVLVHQLLQLLHSRARTCGVFLVLGHYHSHHALILSLILVVSSEDISFHEPVESSFLTKFYCLMIRPKEVQHSHT